MSYLKGDPKSIVESSINKIEEGTLRISKSDISKINGLFQQHFQDKFGFAAVYSHDLGMNMKLTNVPDGQLDAVRDFYKLHGVDTEVTTN